jgi:hypothetical protein
VHIVPALAAPAIAVEMLQVIMVPVAALLPSGLQICTYKVVLLGKKQARNQFRVPKVQDCSSVN